MLNQPGSDGMLMIWQPKWTDIYQIRFNALSKISNNHNMLNSEILV